MTTGIFDYNPDTIGMEKNVNQLGNIISSGSDPRIEVYKYTCDCHGDNSDDRITITNYGTSRESREKAIAKIPPNALPYCTITRYEGKGISGWNFDNCQTPAYLMGVKINGYRFTVELDIAPKYEKAKAALARSYISGIKQPHYTESYYILAKNADAGGFK